MQEEIVYPSGEIKVFELGRRVYNHYCKTTKNNENLTYEQVQKKLTRNVLMSKLVEPKEEGKTLYLYGNLHILVVGNTIVWIKNHKKGDKFHSRRFTKDMAVYNLLGYMLGIPDESVNECV